MTDTKPIAPKIGIIYPPPEVRNIVDKTASFVARNGPDFESRIRQNEINNPKFNFLSPNDPYHAYYQHKVKDFTEGKALEPTVPKSVTGTSSKLNQETPRAIIESFIPKEPPKDFEYIYEAPSITAQDIDIVKLTAQFVARNGRQFLTQLMNREQRNYQFDFLRSQHSMFGYFTKLVEQYAKILLPPKELVTNLKNELKDQEAFMESLRYRVEWFRHEERIRKSQEEAAERERVAYAMIDWHDFVVVETVDFQANEIGNFPLPTTPEEVGGRVIARERGDPEQQAKERQPPVPIPPPPTIPDENDGLSDGEESAPVKKPAPHRIFHKTEDDMELSDEEKERGKSESGEKKMPPPPPIQPAPSIPNPANVIIRNYNPKSSQKPTGEQEVVHLVSPLTGEKIPASQAPKHVKVGLLDPKWIEQKDKEIRIRAGSENVFASGAQVSTNLKSLAERRSDIFGVDTPDKVGGEKKAQGPAPIEWDGHAISADSAMRQAQKAVTQEQCQAHMEEELRLEAERSKIGVSLPGEPELKRPREDQ